MEKKKKLKTLLILSILAMIGAPVVGIKISIDRLIDYHEEEEPRGKTEGTHYLGDIEDINGPGVTGVMIGFLFFISTIVFTISYIRERKPKQSIVTNQENTPPSP